MWHLLTACNDIDKGCRGHVDWACRLHIDKCVSLQVTEGVSECIKQAGDDTAADLIAPRTRHQLTAKHTTTGPQLMDIPLLHHKRHNWEPNLPCIDKAHEDVFCCGMHVHYLPGLRKLRGEICSEQPAWDKCAFRDEECVCLMRLEGTIVHVTGLSQQPRSKANDAACVLLKGLKGTMQGCTVVVDVIVHGENRLMAKSLRMKAVGQPVGLIPVDDHLLAVLELLQP
mmetsp:Transcript_177432/g.431607  ORF Transcript_177432/g.431607 Transcript_177432/m.431607 type:complete len:227 (-) Transcript_177432:385-1065(-)